MKLGEPLRPLTTDERAAFVKLGWQAECAARIGAKHLCNHFTMPEIPGLALMTFEECVEYGREMIRKVETRALRYLPTQEARLTLPERGHIVKLGWQAECAQQVGASHLADAFLATRDVDYDNVPDSVSDCAELGRMMLRERVASMAARVTGDAMYARMQEPGFEDSIKAAFAASPAELGRAAVEGNRYGWVVTTTLERYLTRLGQLLTLAKQVPSRRMDPTDGDELFYCRLIAMISKTLDVVDPNMAPSYDFSNAARGLFYRPNAGPDAEVGAPSPAPAAPPSPLEMLAELGAMGSTPRPRPDARVRHLDALLYRIVRNSGWSDEDIQKALNKGAAGSESTWRSGWAVIVYTRDQPDEGPEFPAVREWVIELIGKRSFHSFSGPDLATVIRRAYGGTEPDAPHVK